MIHKLIRQLAPVAAIALSAAVAGCGDMNIEINGEEGVPLAELDMSGEAPTSVVIAGPDSVVLREGDALAIDVEGDSAVTELLRFSLKDGTLGISRKNGNWKDTGTAIVRVTMPAPRSIVVAGSGSVEVPTMASEAEVTIAGSGKVAAAGTAERLELNVVGSGSGEMAGLKVDRAEVTVAGSGDTSFASDGTVEANIVGSGDVRVIGSATCTINAMGSGTLKCEASAPKPAEAE